MDNYAKAILIAYKLYCKLYGKTDFNLFESIVENDYINLTNKIENNNYIE